MIQQLLQYLMQAIFPKKAVDPQLDKISRLLRNLRFFNIFTTGHPWPYHDPLEYTTQIYNLFSKMSFNIFFSPRLGSAGGIFLSDFRLNADAFAIVPCVLHAPPNSFSITW
jgi:hypothetical protein